MTTPLYPLALLPSLGVFALLVLGRRPELGYYAIVFLIPFGAYRKLAGEGVININIPWIIAFLLIVILGLRWIIAKEIPTSLRSNIWSPFFLLFLLGVISAMLSPYPGTALKNAVMWGAASLFVLLSLVFISQRDFIHTMPGVFVWSISLSASLAVLGTFFNITWFVKEGVYVDEHARAVGASTDPNNMSLMIIFVIPLLVHQALHATSTRGRFLAVFLLAINLMGVISTFSRGGALVLTLTIALILFHHIHRLQTRLLGFFLMPLLLVAIVGYAVIPASYWEHQKTVIGSGDKSLSRRTSYLIVAWDSFKDNPLLGSGPGTFREIFATSEYAQFYHREGKTKKRFAHNTYLEFLVGFGLPGLILFLLLQWRAYDNFTKAQQRLMQKGLTYEADLVGSYRLALVTLLIYLVIYSEPQQKFMLISLALSQIALNLSQDANAVESVQGQLEAK